MCVCVCVCVCLCVCAHVCVCVVCMCVGGSVCVNLFKSSTSQGVILWVGFVCNMSGYYGDVYLSCNHACKHTTRNFKTFSHTNSKGS